MKKRTVATMLALLVAISAFPAMSAAADSPSSWATEAVARAGSLGLLPSGLNSDYTQNITRAEFCALAVPVYEKFMWTAITQLKDFTDTTDINVRKMGGVNVVSGYGGGVFSPNSEITRQEAAVILANLMSALKQPLPASEPTFADNASIDEWAKAAVGQMQKAGIMAGTGNNNFTPKGDGGKYTREQTIVTLMRAMDMATSLSQIADKGAAVKGKILVAYFSNTGNTRKIAEFAAETLKADIFEIKPETPYTAADLNYGDLSSRSSKEMNDPLSRPAISGKVEDFSKYDVVLIGYPIWWGQAPRIISTFVESHDFSGKTILPFCTSGSSAIGASATNLHSLADSSAVWLPGTRLAGGTGIDGVEEWLESVEGLF